ncbi:MAG: hypothetical protein ACLFPO_12070, partial [Spirochaetaceae bacterium]
MNKLAVIAAFLALSSCATFTGDSDSADETPPETDAEETAQATEPASEEERDPDPDVPRVSTSPRRTAEVPDLAAPSPPPASDSLDPTPRLPDSEPGPGGMPLPRPPLREAPADPPVAETDEV